MDEKKGTPEPEQTLKSVFSRNKTLPLEREEKNKVLENQILLLIKTLLDELILFRVPICLSYIYIHYICEFWTKRMK